MNLLFRLIHASACRSTHHKLALDALRFLQGPQADRWRDLLLKYHVDYLRGAKAPDDEFKDFRNHVLHVGDNYWGGAVKAAEEWQERAVATLREGHWPKAAYTLGVLSHYYTDPIQPFHTGQSTAENNVHRAAEWSICKAYDQLWGLFEANGDLPEIEAPDGDDWLARMVRAGAERSHPHYETLIEHYDLARGVSDPPAGLDATSREILSGLLGYAAVGWARVLERTFEESQVDPPACLLTVETFLATIDVPVQWVTGKLADAKERAYVRAMYDELRSTGKVEELLPPDDRLVREAHRREVLGGGKPSTAATTRPVVPSARSLEPLAKPRAAPAEQRDPPRVRETPRIEPAPAATSDPKQVIPKPHVPTIRATPPERPTVAAAVARATPTETRPTSEARIAKPAPQMTTAPQKSAPASAPAGRQRFYLEPTSRVEDAPSIGGKTAQRLERVGVRSVADLLAADAEQLSARLAAKHLTPATIRDWQDQARLVCQIPNLRGHDAQMLVACGCRQAEQVAVATADRLLQQSLAFAGSDAGQRTLRGGSEPDLNEVRDWIAWAVQARSLPGG